MSSSTVTHPPKRGRKVLAVLALVVGVPLLIAAFVAMILAGGGLVASPASVVGAPVRAQGPQGDRVYVLTSQWKTYRSVYRSHSSYTDLLVDVWAFDAAGAKPAWRRRIAQERSGANAGRALLGAQGGVLWLLDARGLVGLSLKDGAPVADVARIEAANPALKGLLPTEERYYSFDGRGLAFKAADGRDWRMTGEGLKAAVLPALTAAQKAAEEDKKAAAGPGVFPPARVAGGSGTYAFQERGLELSDRWLGLLAPEEVESFRTNGAIGGADPENHPRVRLWSAMRGSRATFFGARPVYRDFAPLPEGPEFLYAGLLSDGGYRSDRPLLLFKPDSLLVLHRDRLGEASRWKLTRISGPAGKVLWTADLPLQAVEAVLPGEGSVVLLGRRDEPAPKYMRRDARPQSIDQLVALDLASGRMGVYGFKVKPTKGEEIPPSSTTADGGRAED